MKTFVIWSILLSAVLGAFFIAQSTVKPPASIPFNPNWTIREFADRNDMKPGAVKRLLRERGTLRQELYGSTRLSELNLAEDQVRKALSRSSDLPRFFVLKFGIWALGLGFILQYVLTVRNKTRIGRIRAAVLAVVVLGLGFLTGPSPNPMQSTVHLAKYLAGIAPLYRYAAFVFLIFAVFSVISPKLFCSWACPLGALQETVFNIPLLKRYKLRIPFAWGMATRIVVFVALLLGFFVFAGDLHGRSLLRPVNYFNVFEPSKLGSAALYTLPVLVLLSFFIFRPFCHWICPFGLLSWILEKVSVRRIVVDRDPCVDCRLCVKACPTDAMRGILDSQKRIFQADCWSCSKCVASCPHDAIQLK